MRNRGSPNRDSSDAQMMFSKMPFHRDYSVRVFTPHTHNISCLDPQLGMGCKRLHIFAGYIRGPSLVKDFVSLSNEGRISHSTTSAVVDYSPIGENSRRAVEKGLAEADSEFSPLEILPGEHRSCTRLVRLFCSVWQ